MPRLGIKRLVLALALSMFLITVNAKLYMQPRYVEFEGQEFCALRSRLNDGPCCPNRIDECSVPIGDNRTGWTKCYCDEFCDRRFNPDCCPDYESVCKGRKSVKTCNLDGKVLQILQEAKVDCNLW